jgi:hypothetical protein
MTDQRGRLLLAAVGFAGCSMPSYDSTWGATIEDLFTREVTYVAGSSSGLHPLRVCCCPTSST